MPFKLELHGFDDLRRELAALPDTLKRESAPIESSYASAAMAEVVTAYPEVSGRLRGGVRIVERVAHGVATLFTLITSSPIAHIYEFGSVHQRPRATFLPITERARRQSTAAVAAMVEATGPTGIVVTGKRD
jgi:hypothetical protein